MNKIKAIVDNFKIVPIDDIYPDTSNTNTHPQEQIDMLVEQFKIQGFRDPLIVDKGDGLLVCGEGRLIAAKKAGFKELPVIYQEFDSVKHKKAFITAHNATQQWSKIDLGKVNSEVLELGPDFDLSWLALKDFEIEPAEKEGPKEVGKNPAYKIEVDCGNEEQRDYLNGELSDRGFKVQVLT